MSIAPGAGFNPLAIGQVVARNIVPVVGILAFDWPTSSVLLLYFVDTMLSIGVMFAGLLSWLNRGSVEDRWAARLNAEVGYVAGAAFIAAFIAVPLGMPLVFVGAYAEWKGVGELMSDPGLQAGIAWQVVAAAWSYAGLWRELHVRSPDELRLKRRFALVFLRWFVIVVAVYSPLAWLGGRLLPLLLVVLYVATSIFAEIAPDRFLRMMPGGAEEAASHPGASPSPGRHAGGSAARRRRERR